MSAWQTVTWSGTRAAVASARPHPGYSAPATGARPSVRGLPDRHRGVGEQAGVVIVLRSADSPGHDPGILRGAWLPFRVVAGLAGGPPAALTAGVHDEGE